MRSTRAALIGCALSCVTLAAACGRSGSEATPRGSSSAVAVAAPERPAELVGVGALAPARAFWPALRAALHVRDPSLPRSWGAALSTAAGLPITAAELFEDDRPSRIAVVKSEADTSLVLAVPVRAADRLLVAASSGRDARYDRVREGRLELLRPRHGADERALCLGVSGNHLLLATSERALRLAGPWLADAGTRGPELGATQVLKLDLPPELRLGPHFALHASMLRPLGELIASALPSVGELVGSSQPGLIVSAHELGWTFELSGAVAPGPSSRVSPSGVADVLLTLPGELSAAVVVHADDSARLEQARQARSALETLASERGLDPFTRLDELEALAKARGAVGWVGVERSPVGALAYGRLELGDPEAAGVALDALFGVPRTATPGSAPAPQRVERSTSGKGLPRRRLRRTVLERVGQVYELLLRPEDELAPSTTLYARIESGGLLVGVGGDAAQALERVRTSDTPRLGDLPWLRDAVRLAPAGADAAGFVDLAALNAPRPSGPDAERRPIVLAVDGAAKGRRFVAILAPETLAALVEASRR